MTVVFERKPEVSRIPRRVLRLLHTAKHDFADYALFRRAFYVVQQFLVLRRVHALVHDEVIIERRNELFEFQHFFLVRRFVHAVNERQLGMIHKLRNGFVCKQHKFFDNKVAFVIRIRRDVQDLPVFYRKLRLFRDKIYAAAISSFRVQYPFKVARARYHIVYVGVFSMSFCRRQGFSARRRRSCDDCFLSRFRRFCFP